jgi:Amt family ammonium transporter
MACKQGSCRARRARGGWVTLAALALVCGLASSVHAGEAGTAQSLVSSATRGEADTGDTAWMLISAALVMFMMPGLALFYAGMVRRKNVLGTMMHSMAVLGIVGLEWVILGYAMAFGKTHGGIVGWDSQLLFLRGVMPEDLHTGTKIPELVFIMFQGMFAIITPALITGAFAERVKFSSYALFTLLWSILIYNPLAHWVWGGGWLGQAPTVSDGLFHVGAIDFAGGTVVHISAGVSALVTALYIGKRLGYPNTVIQPNALVLTLLGAGMLWFGWFGFNGGSALGSGKLAAVAFSATNIAAAAGAMGWLIAEWLKHGRPTTLGVASGLVAGLVAITPASGYVSPGAAMAIGGIAGVVCYLAVLTKSKMGYDDSLDAFGVHGIGGILGALLTGVFCQMAFNNQGADGLLVTGQFGQLRAQAIAALAAAAYGAIGTLVIVTIVDKLIGFRLKQKYEIEGMDAGLHGEQGWMLDQSPLPTVGLPGDASVDLLPSAASGPVPIKVVGRDESSR